MLGISVTAMEKLTHHQGVYRIIRRLVLTYWTIRNYQIRAKWAVKKRPQIISICGKQRFSGEGNCFSSSYLTHSLYIKSSCWHGGANLCPEVTMLKINASLQEIPERKFLWKTKMSESSRGSVQHYTDFPLLSLQQGVTADFIHTLSVPAAWRSGLDLCVAAHTLSEC